MRAPEVHNTLAEVNRKIVALGWALVTLLATLLALEAPADAQPRTRRTRTNVVDVCAGEPGVKLVTMGIGSLIWERHGHIALCTCYPDPRQNACYNYGIGDFAKPLNMAWGFFRGTNSFWVGKMDPFQMIWIYQHADRTVWVQHIPLTGEQQQQVIAKLEHDILEENKHYSYDHFWDNCTTRVRDILDDATGGALRSMTNKTDGRTYRDLAREGFYGMTIPLLITDIAMGRVTDRVPTYWERMFLPDYLREAAHARWGVVPQAVYQRQGPPPLKDSPSGRIWFVLVVLLITSPAWLSKLAGRLERAGLAFAVVPAAFMGLVFWFLAVISPLPYVRWNETLLCLVPFDALLLILSGERRKRYARGRVIMLALVAALLLVGVLKMPIWPVWLWGLIPNLVVGFWPARGQGRGARATG